MEYKIGYKAKNAMNDLPLSSLSLDGDIGRRFDKFVYERVSGEFAVKEILRETEKHFADKYDDEYGAGSNKPIAIRVSISADGKIIDCYTMSHSESEGYGDKCATDAYYDGWRGVTVDGVSGSGVITGATYTTDGYRAGIKIAFKAFEILTGGADNEA